MTGEIAKPNRRICGRICEVFSRVVGYYRPIRDINGKPLWNRGKQQEFKDRKVYDMEKAKGKPL
jgi:anaerobic ribonucleoside-triphosphate reductase